MNPFRGIRHWKRKDWDAPKTGDAAARRQHAEAETDHDLQIAVQQFLSDVHEEADHPWPERPYDEHMTVAESRIVASLRKLAGIHKRTTALLTVNAYESSVTSRWVILLTVVLSILTIILIFDTHVLVRVAKHTDAQIQQIRKYAEFQRQQDKKAPPVSEGQKDGIGRWNI